MSSILTSRTKNNIALVQWKVRNASNVETGVRFPQAVPGLRNSTVECSADNADTHVQLVPEVPQHPNRIAIRVILLRSPRKRTFVQTLHYPRLWTDAASTKRGHGGSNPPGGTIQSNRFATEGYPVKIPPSTARSQEFFVGPFPVPPSGSRHRSPKPIDAVRPRGGSPNYMCTYLTG